MDIMDAQEKQKCDSSEESFSVFKRVVSALFKVPKDHIKAADEARPKRVHSKTGKSHV